MPDSYAPDKSYGPKSLSRDLHYAPPVTLGTDKTYAPDTHYVPVDKLPTGPFIVARGKDTSNEQDQHGNPKRYKLSGALALISAFFLEPFAGTFIRNLAGGAYWDQVWPSLPIRNWKSALFSFFSGWYVGKTLHLPPVDPPQPPPPPYDSTPPVITSFVMPTSADSRSVDVTEFTATDNDGVIGYQITEDPTPPPSDGLWYTSPLTRFVFANYGPNSAFAWVMDKTGNVSNYAIQVVDCVPSSPPAAIEPLDPPPQRVPPEVGAFTLAPINSSQRKVTVVTFEGQSWLAITGYLITDSMIPPRSNDARWSATKPTSYVFPADGEQTAYAWVKDASDTVSTYKAFVVTVDAEGVPTYARTLMMDHGYDNPYGSITTMAAKNATFNLGNRYPATRWYAQNKWIQAVKTWDHGETEQGVIALDEDSNPQTFHRGAYYGNNATPYLVPADEGRIIAFNTATEEYIYIGAPDITIIDVPGVGPVGETKMNYAPLLPAQGRPENNGHLYYCDGETGAYMGGDDVVYAFTFYTTYACVDLEGGNYNYTFKHILGDQYHGTYERAGIANSLPGNFTLLSTDPCNTTGRYPTTRFRDLFLADKTAVLAGLLNRGRKPIAASNAHDAGYTSGQQSWTSNHTYVWWLAVCTGKIPNGAHGDITIDGVVSLSMISFAVDKFYNYDGLYSPAGLDMGAPAPNVFPIHYPTAYAPCQPGGGDGNLDAFAFMSYGAVETALGLPFYAYSIDNMVYVGGNNLFATVTGYPEDEAVEASFTEYLQVGYPKDYAQNGYSCPYNPPAADPHTYYRKTFPQGQKTWTIYSTDRALTWNRLVAFGGLTEAQLSGSIVGIKPLNGGDLCVLSAQGNLWRINTGSGDISKMDPYGYDLAGSPISILNRVSGIIGNTDASNGELIFYTSTYPGDLVNPTVRYFISSSSTTIETHGPKIKFVNSVTCFGPDAEWAMTGFTVTGFADNIITVDPPLPHTNTIVLATYEVETVVPQKRLLLLSDFGSTVYDVGWVEQSWNGQMMIDTFAGGGWDPEFSGDFDYPYTPPIFVPLQFTNGPDLGRILAAVEGEWLQIQVMGGRFPYVFEVTAGALPTGMAMDPVGYIGGVATIGSYSFTIKVTDNEGTIISQAFTCEVV